ncbi:hypothetical protein [Flavobacterium daejeonense]|uniref:hypothetical protein n=1 Tax=Flavobacterium daejeonense TaxID=350893 RepID=UPI00047C69A2|nr:hypothetical protein [Flavobacterium daejeonense]
MGTATPLVAAAWASAGAGLVSGSLGVALNGGNFGQIVLGGLKGAAMGAMTGYAGAYMSAAIHAVGIIPGMLSGAATSTTLTAMTNIISGNDWNAGLGMTALFGTIGGGISGFSAAKASGSGIWFGTEVKPSATVIAGKIDDYTKEAKAQYNKSTQVQAEPTGMSLNDLNKTAEYPASYLDRPNQTGTPNSVHQYKTIDGKSLQNTVYNIDGKAVIQLDFKSHGTGNMIGVPHGHIMDVPGIISTGHQGEHIPFMLIKFGK